MNQNVLHALLRVTFGCLKAQAQALSSVVILKTGPHLCAYSLHISGRIKDKNKPPSCTKYTYESEMSCEHSRESKADTDWGVTQKITIHQCLSISLMQLNQRDACPREEPFSFGDG